MNVNGVSWSPDSITLLTGSDDCNIRVWNIQPNLSKLVRAIKGKFHTIL
jgi:WD40 repeat protein